MVNAMTQIFNGLPDLNLTNSNIIINGCNFFDQLISDLGRFYSHICQLMPAMDNCDGSTGKISTDF